MQENRFIALTMEYGAKLLINLEQVLLICEEIEKDEIRQKKLSIVITKDKQRYVVAETIDTIHMMISINTDPPAVSNNIFSGAAPIIQQGIDEIGKFFVKPPASGPVTD